MVFWMIDAKVLHSVLKCEDSVATHPLFFVRGELFVLCRDELSLLLVLTGWEKQRQKEIRGGF